MVDYEPQAGCMLVMPAPDTFPDVEPEVRTLPWLACIRRNRK